MIKIGMSLVLEMIENGQIEKYRCRIIEQSGSFLFVDYPVNEKSGKTGFFQIGTEFLADFVGADGSVYRFATELKSKESINVPSLVLNYPGDARLKRIQRREYVRIESSNDIAIHPLNGEFSPFTSVTFDISGGGLSFFLPDEVMLVPGTRMEIWLVLPLESGAYEYIQTFSEAVRLSKGKEGKKSTLSIKYYQIDDRARQGVIRYCFNQQLKARRHQLE